MSLVFFDYETRSPTDLRKTGAHRYARDPRTDVMCMAWAVDDGPIKIWRPLDGDPHPVDFIELMLDPNTQFIAHNAQFEKLITDHVCTARYGWPALPIRQLYCTMTYAYGMGLVGGMQRAAKIVGLPIEKDMAGNRIMLQLSKPRSINLETGAIKWWERADSTATLDINDKYERMYTYCMGDIDVTRELFKRLLPLAPEERQTWFLDQIINDRGVYIDVVSVKRAIELADFEAGHLNTTMRDMTGGFVTSCNAHAKLKQWINEQGVETDSTDKAAVKDLLEADDVPPHVKQVLQVRKEAGKSSVSKLKKMLLARCEDGRCRGNFQFLGASSTGRWAGRGIQLQNMPRPTIKFKQVEQIIRILST